MEFIEVVDGMMLGNASMERMSDSSARVRATVCSDEHKHLLKTLWKDIPHKFYKNETNGYTYERFMSSSQKFLWEHYERWYLDVEDDVPRSVQITPVSVLMWTKGCQTEHPRAKASIARISGIKRAIEDELGYSVSFNRISIRVKEFKITNLEDLLEEGKSEIGKTI